MIRVFLGGDVMTGRGIDQILPHPVPPDLDEIAVDDAGEYVRLAEAASGPVPRPVAPAEIWGEALTEIASRNPAVRIVNLETSVTRSDDAWQGKAVHYRMSPENAVCLRAGAVDVCALANNHVLDYGRTGLRDTIHTLDALGVCHSGAGADKNAAQEPAIVTLDGGRRTVIFGVGCADSGIPRTWAATNQRSGVAFFAAPTIAAADDIVERVRQVRRSDGARDLIVVSVHWGSNWGYELDDASVAFAHRLVDGGVDVVHGHSSHHPRPIEVFRGRLILYGCGDLIDDYEGIGGHEEYRGDIALLYFADIDDDGTLARLEMVPMRERRMRPVRCAEPDVGFIADALAQVSRPFGTVIEAAQERGVLAIDARRDRDA